LEAKAQAVSTQSTALDRRLKSSTLPRQHRFTSPIEERRLSRQLRMDTALGKRTKTCVSATKMETNVDRHVLIEIAKGQL
jgi:hypothetical protein